MNQRHLETKNVQIIFKMSLCVTKDEHFGRKKQQLKKVFFSKMTLLLHSLKVQA